MSGTKSQLVVHTAETVAGTCPKGHGIATGLPVCNATDFVSARRCTKLNQLKIHAICRAHKISTKSVKHELKKYHHTRGDVSL